MATYQHNFKVKNGLTVENTAGNDSTITLKDNSATAFVFKEGSNTFLAFDTTNGSEKIDFQKNVDFSGVTVTGLGSSGLSGTLFTAGSTAVEQGDTINVAGTTNEIEVSETGGTFTVGLPTNVTITGNLTVNGTTTTVNSTTMTVDDPILTLGGDTAAASDDNKDRGVEFQWHTGSTAVKGFFGMDDTDSKFMFIPQATNSSEVISGSVGGAKFGSIDIDNLSLDGNTITSTTADLTVDASHDIVLDADGGNITLKDAGTTTLDIVMNGATSVTFDAPGDVIFDTDGANFTLKDAGTTYMDIVANGATDVTIDVPGTLKLDSANGYIDLVDDGVIFGQLMNHSSGNLKLMSGNDDLAVMFVDTAATFGGDVTVPGATTLQTTLDVTGISNFNDTTQSTSNTTGAVIIDGGLGLAKNLHMGGALDVDGNATVHGNLVVNGNTDLGDATSDTLTVTARVDSDFVPSTDGARDLGTSTLRWAELHADKALLQGEITGVDYVDFDTSHSTPSNSEGRLFYNNTFDALAFYTNDSNNTIVIGQELFQRVYNDTGSTVTAGKAVRFTDATAGGTPKIALADKSSAHVENTVGLVFSDIADAAYGFVSTYGLVEGIDTSGITAGARVHVGSNGSLQETAPGYPDFAVDVGLCLVSDGTNGCILIDIHHHLSETYRTTGDARFEGDVTVGGNLTILGSTTETAVNSLSVEDPYIFLSNGDSIGASGTTQSTGSGLNDATLIGLFQGTSSTTYYVKIDGTGTPDTFSWSKDNFSSTEATGVAITGNAQALDNGIKVKFVSTTGHTQNDVWSGTASPTNQDVGVVGFRNTGSSGVGFTQVGLFFDVTDQKWRLFDEYDPALTGNVNTSDSSFSLGGLVLSDVTATTFTGALTGNATTATEASTIHTVQRSTNATHYLTFVDSDDASLSVNAVYTDAGVSYNPSTNKLTVSGDLSAGTLETHTIPSGTGTLALTSDISNSTVTITAGDGLGTGGTFTLNGGTQSVTLINSDKGSSQNIFKTITTTDTDSGYSWSATGSAVADTNSDTLTLVDGGGVDISIDAAQDAFRIQHTDTSTLSGAYGQTGTEDGTYIKSVTVDGYGHVTAITTEDFDDRYSFTAAGDSGSSQTITHGNTLTIAGGNAISTVASNTDIITINHDDTSSASSVDNSNGNVIQDVTIDTYGHVTGLGSVNLDNRYVLDSNVDNGAVSIKVNDADFIVNDSTDGTTNFIWRDHSESRLYLGTPAAVLTPRTDIDMDGSGTAYNITDAKSIGVGTAASGNAGDIRATADVTAYYSSDARLKDNVEVIADPIGKLSALRGVTFDWTEDYIQEKGGEDGYFVRKHDVGVIAQEVEAVLPEVVGTRENGIKAVRYDRMVALLIEAVKTQQTQIEALTDQLNTIINNSSES